VADPASSSENGPGGCAHCPGSHTGELPCLATATTNARGWLIIEHPGPWPAEIDDLECPEAVAAALEQAGRLGVRRQLIRRPGRRRRTTPPLRVYVGHTGTARFEGRELADPAELAELDLAAVAAGGRPGHVVGARAVAGIDVGSGIDPTVGSGINPTVGSGAGPGVVSGVGSRAGFGFGDPITDPLLLVCTHGRHNACCARAGVPLARDLRARFGDAVWETTHVGGDRYAANLVCLPHGFYYGSLGPEEAVAAVEAYRRGEVVLDRLRGRAGLPEPAQAAEHFVRSRLGITGADAVTVESVTGNSACEAVVTAAGECYRLVLRRSTMAAPCGPGCVENLATYLLTDIGLLNGAALV
jgi:sucrase/ferredoxin-like protein